MFDHPNPPPPPPPPLSPLHAHPLNTHAPTHTPAIPTFRSVTLHPRQTSRSPPGQISLHPGTFLSRASTSRSRAWPWEQYSARGTLPGTSGFPRRCCPCLGACAAPTMWTMTLPVCGLIGRVFRRQPMAGQECAANHTSCRSSCGCRRLPRLGKERRRTCAPWFKPTLDSLRMNRHSSLSPGVSMHGNQHIKRLVTVSPNVVRDFIT